MGSAVSPAPENKTSQPADQGFLGEFGTGMESAVKGRDVMPDGESRVGPC
jgi:hypothetical protein